MHGENLLVNDSSDRKAVKAIGESLPQLDVIATLALVVESINTVDGGTLVVTSKDEEVFGVLDLVGEEQADGLKRLLSSVDVITEEEVVGLGREATVLEESEKIVVLSVNITTDLTRRRKAGQHMDSLVCLRFGTTVEKSFEYSQVETTKEKMIFFYFFYFFFLKKKEKNIP